MYYAEVTNGEITKLNITLPYSTKEYSIPKGCLDVTPFNLYPITGSEPTYNASLQRLNGPTYDFNGTEVVRTYTVTDIPVEELTARFIDQVTEATQSRLDTFAKTRNYDGVLSACTYASSTVPKFQLEGQYCVNSRDSTWATLYTIMSEVQGGTRPMPTTVDEVMALLPVLEWPTT